VSPFFLQTQTTVYLSTIVSFTQRRLIGPLSFIGVPLRLQHKDINNQHQITQKVGLSSQ